MFFQQFVVLRKVTFEGASFNVQCTMLNVQCTVYNVQCTVYNVKSGDEVKK
jgi:hypothetical protein